ncbi:RNA 3'-phosphate cyclase [Methanocalculus taiwanensis]|uniref:RNA 3'-terminal phosphate cyclase n=1 Tax=Methanocalculus taiwanensis TaxID=106207 RepID=A0ABD4TL91_9EURY|nr:RNA 3'-terminal phosphate cyclase [Methanocalculus taiwanensis]MCQ1538733.1 RNA 3'-phosphate cyclase [Methanocalculus taiwanensis]
MITIDGGTLEGGGQIVRTAVALSSVSGEPVTIRNIRKNRSIPGLAAQHVAAVKAAAAISNASTTGVSIGTGEITFLPGEPERKDICIDIGTAGSIPLVLSAWLPLAIRIGGSITITGGTEVRDAPTIDYCECVFLEYLRTHGGRISLEILVRGYYPEGGGRVRVVVEPSRIAPLGTFIPAGSGIVSASSGLPDHVATRQADAAASVAGDLPIHIVRQKGSSIGSSCTVFSGGHGGSALGKQGLPAEAVGRMAAESFLQGRSFDLDPHACDQLLPYLALYGGSIGTTKLTSHAMTMISLLGHFGYPISIASQGDCVEVSA